MAWNPQEREKKERERKKKKDVDAQKTTRGGEMAYERGGGGVGEELKGEGGWSMREKADAQARDGSENDARYVGGKRETAHARQTMRGGRGWEKIQNTRRKV